MCCLSDPLIWKRVIDSQAEKLKELDKEIRPFRQNWEEADSMKSSVESLQNRVTELESVDKSAGQAARNTGEAGGPAGGVRIGAGLGRAPRVLAPPGRLAGSQDPRLAAWPDAEVSGAWAVLPGSRPCAVRSGT